MDERSPGPLGGATLSGEGAPLPRREGGDAPLSGGPITAETLARVREREPQAMAMFFEFYFDRVYGLAARLLGDRTYAEDVTQDVFQKVHRAAHQLDPARDPGPWLMAVTHNACRDVWRSRAYKLAQKSRSLDEPDGPAAALPAPGDTPEEATLRAERARLVQEAIVKLPEELREVVVLHDYQGLGHEEIARLTGATHVATRKRYSRALARLGEALKDLL